MSALVKIAATAFNTSGRDAKKPHGLSSFSHLFSHSFFHGFLLSLLFPPGMR
jgi:hypothetical protein